MITVAWLVALFWAALWCFRWWWAVPSLELRESVAAATSTACHEDMPTADRVRIVIEACFPDALAVRVKVGEDVNSVVVLLDVEGHLRFRMAPRERGEMVAVAYAKLEIDRPMALVIQLVRPWRKGGAL